MRIRIILAAMVAALTLIMSAQSFAEGGDYRLGSDDLLKIGVFDHIELSVDVRVSKSGNITFPLLGEVAVTGLSTRELEQLLVRQLKEGGFVKQPQVSVLVTEYQSQKVAVMGQVAKPGQYPLSTANKVMDLLAQAGGPINGMAADEATLIKRDGSKVQIDLYALFQGDPRQNPSVSGGDALFVPRAPIFYIYGEVQRPGPYRLERNMTVTQAIAAGGGLTPKGSEHRLRVKRRDGSGNVRETSIKGKDLLKPDDVLSVKESWF